MFRVLWLVVDGKEVEICMEVGINIIMILLIIDCWV